MSTVERTKPKALLPPLAAGQHLDQPTFHERYEAMPPETRAELVGGIVYMPSPMRLDHGDTSRIVSCWFGHYQWKTPGVTGADGATVMLDLQGEPQPDHFLRIPAELGGQTFVDEQGYLFVGRPDRRRARELAAADQGFTGEAFDEKTAPHQDHCHPRTGFVRQDRRRLAVRGRRGRVSNQHEPRFA